MRNSSNKALQVFPGPFHAYFNRSPRQIARPADKLQALGMVINEAPEPHPLDAATDGSVQPHVGLHGTVLFHRQIPWRTCMLRMLAQSIRSVRP